MGTVVHVCNLGSLSQEDPEFKVSMGYLRPHLKQTNNMKSEGFLG